MASMERGVAVISILLDHISFISEHRPAAMGKLLSGRKAGPGPRLSLDRQSTQCVLTHKPLPVLANICPGRQMQRELLSSKMLLRVELSFLNCQQRVSLVSASGME